MERRPTAIAVGARTEVPDGVVSKGRAIAVQINLLADSPKRVMDEDCLVIRSVDQVLLLTQAVKDGRRDIVIGIDRES